MSWARREQVLAPPARCGGWDPLGFQPPPGLLPACPRRAETQGRAEARASCPSWAGPGQPDPHRASSVSPGPPAARQTPPTPASVSSCEKGPSQTPRGPPPGSLVARRRKRQSPSPPHPTPAAQTPGEDSGPQQDALGTARLQAHAGRPHWGPGRCRAPGTRLAPAPLSSPAPAQPRHPPGAPKPAGETLAPPRPPGPQSPPTPGPALPASHLRSPARQARPPPEREASRCSLMARAGERSHQGGGPTGPRPAGPGSRGPWRCSMVGEPAAGAWEGAREASVSARRLGTRQKAEFPFPRTARPPTLAQTPVTTGRSHWPKPRAA